MKFRTKSLTSPLLTIVLLLFLGPGCKNDKTGSCAPFEFSKENTVNIRMLGSATVFNPLVSKSGYDTYVAAQVFQTLCALEPRTMELVPVLITKVPPVRQVPSGPYAGMLAYDFEIFPGATWDNGLPITARDVIFSLKVILHPALPMGRYQSYFQYLKAVEPDPETPGKFTTYFSRYYILALESLCQIPIYPAYNYDPNGVLTKVPLTDFIQPERSQQLLTEHPDMAAWAEEFQSPKFANDKAAISGSGPYRLESLDVDQGCVLVKKANWWGDKYATENPYTAAFPEKLVYRYMRDDVPVESMIRTGQLDIIPDVAPAKFLALKKDSCMAERYDFSAVGATSFSRLVLNHSSPKLADKRVRQALAHAIDYDYLINTVYQGMATRIVGMVNPAKNFYARDIVPYDYNIQKAKDLLAAAGWTDTNGDGTVDKVINGAPAELEISMLTPASAVTQQMARNIVTTARNAGIKIVQADTDIAVFRELMKKSTNYEMAISGASLFPGLVEFYQVYHSKSIGADNKFNYSSPEADALIEAIRTEPNDAKRNELYIKAQHLFHEDLPEIYLDAPLNRVIVSKRFNYVLTPNRPGYYEQYFRLLK